MLVDEYNNLSIIEKHSYIFQQPENNSRFISYRKSDELTVSLWDCDTFFVEIYYSRKLNQLLKIEGISLFDDRINLYIDYFLKADKEEDFNIIEIA